MVALRFLNAGESHGPELVCVLEGMPSRVPIDVDAIDNELARRQRGFGSGGRMRIEHDRIHITSGVVRGVTTGSPIALRVTNRDFANWREKDIEPMNVPRPGHADLVGGLKYQPRDLRNSLERASARETTTRVAVGAIAKQLLAHVGAEVGGYVQCIGDVDIECPVSADGDIYRGRAAAGLENDLSVPARYDDARARVQSAIKAHDTLGGVVEVFALGLPVGLGSFVHYDRRLDAQIAAAMISVQAMKGVELGNAFENATRPGTEVHDELFSRGGQIVRKTNRAGGLEGGMTTGAPLVVRVAMKPISTTLNPRQSVDLTDGSAASTSYERSDFCAIGRAVPILEGMLAFVLARALLDRTGADTLEQVVARTHDLAKSHVDDLQVEGVPFRFDYPVAP